MSHLWKGIFCRLHESLVMGGLATVRQNSKARRLLTGRVPGSVRPAQTRLLVAGNGSRPGCQAVQECR